MREKATNQLRWLWLSVIVIVLDQVSKWLVTRYLTYNQPIKILPFFNLTYLHNRGAAFGFLHNAGGWQSGIFIIIALVISGVILYLLQRMPRSQHAMACALALILGGAIGNLYDRAVLGYVIDFISLHAGGWYFAVFNIADSAITIGIILWLFLSWRKNPP